MTRDDLFNSSLDQLEFSRVLEHIAGYAASSLGVEHISELMPLSDADAIRRELRMVGEAHLLIQRGDDPPLHGIYDIRDALGFSKISGGFLSGENFLHVVSTMQGMRKSREFFSSRRESYPLLSELTSEIHVNRLLERHIQDAIDETGNVRDNASRDLQRIRRDIIDRSAALRQRLQKILRKVADEELVTDEYVTLREGRLVLPVKNEYKRKIPGIIHGESQSGNTVFLEPAEIFDLNNEIAELTFAERREVEKILKTLTQELAGDADELQTSMWKLQLLDSVAARARYAQRYNCVEPTVVEDDRIVLKDAYHPILLTRLDSVVPMSIELDATQRCVVITGPNAGGKTVAMKTLGLVTMMALCGIHVPAVECLIHPCRVFTDIGDQQSLENDLSTFSAHMSRIGQIVSHVMIGDIVLLDEIGTGTDPDEGGAIAAAILEYLLARRAFILATTHHSYLKIFAYETDAVVNAGMEFDTRTITPTYRLVVGIPGNSYAFELLERFGFENRILEGARGKLGEERNRMTEIIAQLEETLADSRRLREQHSLEMARAEQLRARLEMETKEINDRRRNTVNEAREEARATLAQANSLIENTLREIRSGAANDQVKEMRRAIEEAREKLGPQIEKGPADGGFHKGDTVRLKGGAQVGELEFDPDDKGNVVIQFGSIRMRSTVEEIEAVSRKEMRRETAGRQSVVNAEEAQTRLDLRGKYPDEAIVELEQSLTAALNAHIFRIEVIHGKGTGVLRRRLHEYLASHPSVAAYRLGSLTEGGAGVTMVELK
jgi:DNA mismatch repair protein MutS2